MSGYDGRVPWPWVSLAILSAISPSYAGEAGKEHGNLWVDNAAKHESVEVSIEAIDDALTRAPVTPSELMKLHDGQLAVPCSVLASVDHRLDTGEPDCAVFVRAIAPQLKDDHTAPRGLLPLTKSEAELAGSSKARVGYGELTWSTDQWWTLHGDPVEPLYAVPIELPEGPFVDPVWAFLNDASVGSALASATTKGSFPPIAPFSTPNDDSGIPWMRDLWETTPSAHHSCSREAFSSTTRST